MCSSGHVNAVRGLQRRFGVGQPLRVEIKIGERRQGAYLFCVAVPRGEAVGKAFTRTAGTFN